MNGMAGDYTAVDDDTFGEAAYYDADTIESEEESIERVELLDNDTLEPILSLSAVIEVDAQRERKVTQFVVEDGSTRSDHIIEGPIEVILSTMIVDDLRNAYEELKDLYDSAALVSLQTKTMLITDLLITSIPFFESPDVMDGHTGTITLHEWREVEPEYGDMPPRKVAKKSQANTKETAAVAEGKKEFDPGPASGLKQIVKGGSDILDKGKDILKGFFG